MPRVWSPCTAGYPRTARYWKRGTPLDSATIVYEGEAGDVSVGQYFDRDRGYEYEVSMQHLPAPPCTSLALRLLALVLSSHLASSCRQVRYRSLTFYTTSYEAKLGKGFDPKVNPADILWPPTLRSLYAPVVQRMPTGTVPPPLAAPPRGGFPDSRSTFESRFSDRRRRSANGRQCPYQRMRCSTPLRTRCVTIQLDHSPSHLLSPPLTLLVR